MDRKDATFSKKQPGDFSPWFLGFGLFLSINVVFIWGALPFSSGSWTSEGELSTILPYRLSIAVSIAVTSCLLGGLTLFRSLDKARSLGAKIFATVMAIGSILFTLSFNDPAFSHLSALLGIFIGASHAVYFVLWTSIFGRLKPRSSLTAILYSSILNGFICLALFLIPDRTIPYIIATAMILPAFFTLWKSIQISSKLKPVPETLTVKNPSLRRKTGASIVKQLWIPLLSVCVLGFIFNSTRELAATSYEASAKVNVLSMVGLLVALCAVSIALRFKPNSLAIDRVYPIVSIITASLIIPVTFIGAGYWTTISLIMGIAYLLIIVLLKTTLAKIAYEQSIDPISVFGLGEGINYFAMGLGTTVGILAREENFSTLVPAASIVVIFVYLLSLPLVFKRKKADRIVIIKSINEEDVMVRSEIIAERFGITERELAVMHQLALGKGYADIAKKLTVSENTVRSHSKSIYRKLGIHARKELTEIIEKTEPRALAH